MAAEKGSSNFQQQALMLMADEVDKKKMINDEAQKLKEAFRLAVSKRVESQKNTMLAKQYLDKMNGDVDED